MNNIRKLLVPMLLIGLVSCLIIGDLIPEWKDLMGPAYPGSASGELLKDVVSAPTITETITSTKKQYKANLIQETKGGFQKGVGEGIGRR